MSLRRSSIVARFVLAALFTAFLPMNHLGQVNAQEGQPVDLPSLRQQLAEQNRVRELVIKEFEKSERQVAVDSESVSIPQLQEAARLFAIAEDGRQQLEWWVQSLEKAEQFIQRAAATSNDKLSEALKEQASEAVATSRNLKDILVGRGNFATGAYVVEQLPPPTTPGSDKPSVRYDSSNLALMQQEESRSKDVEKEFGYYTILGNAQETFDKTPGGRSGAGGVALYKAAKMDSDLDLSKARQAVWKEGRLTLVYGDEHLPFPELDREYVARAIRCVHGGEGNVPGQLVAEDGQAIAVATGEEWFGEVVWNKDFLPAPWKTVTAGTELNLGFGPGVGLMQDPRPSRDRVSYYGPIIGSRMGKVLIEADEVFSPLFTGVKFDGSIYTDPVMPGFKTLRERLIEWQLKTTPEDRPETPTNDDEAKWWRGISWFVLVPDRFHLKLNTTGEAFEFVENKMKVEYWSVGVSDAENVRGSEFVAEVTDRYEEFAQTFPALGELVNVAKAVTVVRWLKQVDVPVDLEWAKSVEMQPVETPESIASVNVWVNYAADGKPLLERPEVAP